MINEILNLLKANKSNNRPYPCIDWLLIFCTVIIFVGVSTGCVGIATLPKSTPIAIIKTPASAVTMTSVPPSTPEPTTTPLPTLRVPSLPVNDGFTVTLLEPLEPVISGRQTFRWNTNVSLEENQLFELIFWAADQDPMSYGFGPAGSGKDTSVTIDLDKTATILPSLLIAGQNYQWGILLVESNPYRRLQYLGGGHQFYYEASNGGSSSNSGSGGGSNPTATPRG